MKALNLRLLSIALLACAAGAQDAERAGADEWRQWRGPNRDGSFHGPAWPESLDEEHLALAWKVDGLGPSYSGPIVTSDRVFTTETVEEESEIVRAFDRASGEELWSNGWEGAMKVPFFAARNGSWIRSTPAYDGEALYVAGMRDVLVCLEGDTGEIRWSIDFVDELEAALPPFGFVCSPLVVGESVFVQAGSSALRIDKHTGEIQWRSMEEGQDVMQGGAFSSPTMTELNGRRQLLVQSRAELAGLAPDDGSVLWSLPIKAFRGMNILTPAVHDGGIFTSTYGGGSQLIDVSTSEGASAAEARWSNSSQGYMTSPVIVGGYAYLFMRSNRFSCMDMTTGEVQWTSPPTGDEYWSLTANDDHVLALSNSGMLRLVAANPADYEVLSERQLVDGETWAHVAPAGNQVVVRELGSLAAFEWK